MRLAAAALAMSAGLAALSAPGAQANKLRHPGCPQDQVACTFPPTGATILPGVRFDFKIEIHDDAGKPDDHQVFISHNGRPRVPFTDFFPEFDTYEHSFTYQETRGGSNVEQQVYNEIWREVSLGCPGTYTVTVVSNGEEKDSVWEVPDESSTKAKNGILFVADGMTQAMITAARVIAKGMTHGKHKDRFNMDKFPAYGAVVTSGIDSVITDSANSASAYNTGHKTSTNALGVYGDTTASTVDDPKQETLAEILQQEQGKCIGIISTAEVQDATPAAVWAHTRRRGDKAIITDQFINGATKDGNQETAERWTEGIKAEVLLGGGGRYFHAPSSLDDQDYYKLFDEAGYTRVHSKTELDDVMSAAEPPKNLLGIFHEGNMNVWLDRNIYTDNLQNGAAPDGSGADADDQPGLKEMVQAALRVLGNGKTCPNGFYLMAEAASVDKQMHGLDVHRALADLIEYDVAVGAAAEWADNRRSDDTLIVVTADHGHGFDVYGVADNVALRAGATDVEKKNAIGLYADAGFPTYPEADEEGYVRDWDVQFDLAATVNNAPDHFEDYHVSPTPRAPSIAGVANPSQDSEGFFRSGNLPSLGGSGVHTLVDVPLFARGPGSAAFTGLNDNTEVFHKLASALGAGTVDRGFCRQLDQAMGRQVNSASDPQPEEPSTEEPSTESAGATSVASQLLTTALVAATAVYNALA